MASCPSSVAVNAFRVAVRLPNNLLQDLVRDRLQRCMGLPHLPEPQDVLHLTCNTHQRIESRMNDVAKQHWPVPKYRDGLNPHVWGPPFWNLLFAVAQQSQSVADVLRMAHAYSKLMPCSKCRASFVDLLASSVDKLIEQNRTAVGLAWALKNAVTQKLGTPPPHLTKALFACRLAAWPPLSEAQRIWPFVIMAFHLKNIPGSLPHDAAACFLDAAQVALRPVQVAALRDDAVPQPSASSCTTDCFFWRACVLDAVYAPDLHAEPGSPLCKTLHVLRLTECLHDTHEHHDEENTST